MYATLFNEMATAGTFQLIKFSPRNCQLMAGEQFDEATQRRGEIRAIINRLLPNNSFNYANANHAVTHPTPSDLDRLGAQIVPTITYYNEQYNLTNDLPDHLTVALVGTPPNNVTNEFVTLLGADDLTSLFQTNDPDEQDILRATIQQRADALVAAINSSSSRLVQITLSMTSSGLQITLRTDGKKSFYRHLSDATKFLIAYHVYAHQHQPGAVLLFDEPSRGLHSSAERYLREFLERLAAENHVIVSTHSERLIDLDHLDRIRLMQQDEEGRATVLNSLRPPRDRASYLLALQPIFDAIGLAHTNQTLTNANVVLTEGLTDYLYLRAFHELTSAPTPYGIAPGRGEATLLTIAPFMASQGVSIKFILDHPSVKEAIQETYGISETAIFLIPTISVTRGIEDLFSVSDYARILNAAGYGTTIDDLRIGNSAYAKQTNKRLVAQTFRNSVANYTLDSFDTFTKDNIRNLLTFCADDNWFRF
jgi:energy-coupling factor transporter ATP-binding protein EcfA2